jgi:hypothetical protein
MHYTHCYMSLHASLLHDITCCIQLLHARLHVIACYPFIKCFITCHDIPNYRSLYAVFPHYMKYYMSITQPLYVITCSIACCPDPLHVQSVIFSHVCCCCRCYSHAFTLGKRVVPIVVETNSNRNVQDVTPNLSPKYSSNPAIFDD